MSILDFQSILISRRDQFSGSDLVSTFPFIYDRSWFHFLRLWDQSCEKRKVGDENLVYPLERLNICSELAILSLGAFEGRD